MILHLSKISFIGSFVGGTSILMLKCITNLQEKEGDTSLCLGLPIVLTDCISLDVEALPLFDPEVRGFCMVMAGGALMTRGGDGVSTYILLLDRGGVGELFSG